MAISFSVDENQLMQMAIIEAKRAPEHSDVPVGALLLRENKIVSSRHNERELTKDPTAHAEILVLKDAAEKFGSWYLTECTLVVTLEPCLMCAGAMINSRIKRVVFGALDSKAGACGSLYNVCDDSRLNHQISVTSGIQAKSCGELLSEFFRKLRKS